MDPEKPLLRDCAPPDLTRVQEIYAHAVLHGVASFELAPPDLEQIRSRWERLVQAGYPYLVAELAGAIVGYAYAGAYRPRPAYRATVENSVYVDPGWQRRGIGRFLLEELIRQCEARGFRQMVAVIGDSANTPSIRLHREPGFRRRGRAPLGGLEAGPLARQRDPATAARSGRPDAAGRIVPLGA